MSNKLAGLLTAIFIFATAFAASLLASGCSGEVGGPDEDPAGFAFNPGRIVGPTPVKPVLLPAPAYVMWQFDYCLTQNERDGLILALQDLHKKVPALLPSVGQSQCGTDGQERGALFATDTLPAARSLTVNAVAIRPIQRKYAFAIGPKSFDHEAATEFAHLPHYFDDAGQTAYSSGRYQITGYTQTFNQAGPNYIRVDNTLHVLDPQRQVGVDLTFGSAMSLWAPGYLTVATGGHTVSPASSMDPFVQSVINATNTLGSISIWFTPSAEVGNNAVDVRSAPSLKGWPMPFDLLFLDADGNVVVAGGEQIM
jgi:hypothetical protein